MRKGIDCKGREWEETTIVDPMNDLSDMRFGLLHAICPVKISSDDSRIYWLCLCDCGNYIVRAKTSLVNKTTCSCGCSRYTNARLTAMEKQKENIGKRFGKLIVTNVVDAPSDIKDNRFYYECLCDCGNITTIRSTDVKRGKVISCGCAKSDANARRRKDLTGHMFGKLIVTGFAYIKNRTVYWHCKCECGNEVDVRGADLLNGHTSSCGCMLSLGELNIIKILDTFDVKYIHNKGYFKGLVSDSGLTLRYDFIILNDNQKPMRLIEFDGPQHDKPNDLFGIEEFQKLQYHDALKNQYALNHNIPLVRIPYKKRKTVNFNDLFGDKYLIKGE